MEKSNSLEGNSKSKPVRAKTFKAKLAKIRSVIDSKTIIAFAVGVILTLSAFITVYLISSAQQDQGRAIDYETILNINEYAENIDSSWTVVSEDPSISDVAFKTGYGFEGESIILHFYKTGANNFTFTSSTGESLTLTITIDDKENVSIIRQ